MLPGKMFSAPNFAILPTGLGAAVKIAYPGSDYPYSRQLVETENTDTAAHDKDIAALTRALWIFDDAVKVALEFQNNSREKRRLFRSAITRPAANP